MAQGTSDRSLECEDAGGRHEHAFRDAERWARAFDDPARDAWQKPDEVIRALALPPDALVADLGSGTGYFAVRLARAVPKGHVYGADVEPDMVRYLAERGRREGLANLTSVAAGPADARLPRAVDLVLVVNTYHHIAERPGYFGRLRQSLRPGGRVAVIDFLPDAPAGPPRQARIPAAVAKDEMGRAGYGLASEHTFLCLTSTFWSSRLAERPARAPGPPGRHQDGPVLRAALAG